MTEPRRATLEQWIAVRMMKSPLGDDLQSNAKILDLIPLASCLLELTDRVAALEDPTPQPAPDHLPGATEIPLAPCLLGLSDRVAALEAAATPPPAADHSRGATEMVATDEELEKCWIRMRDGRPSFIDALRVIYNLGRQHGTQPRQEEPTPSPAPVSVDTRDPECVKRWPDCHSEGYDQRCCRFPKDCSCGGDPPATESTPPPTHDPTSAAPLLWVLWHHLGASSPVGQPIRRYLGMGRHERMTSEQVEAASCWADSAGVTEIRAVAAWLDTRGDHGSAAALRREADQ